VEYSRRGRILPGFYPVVLLSHDTASSRYANNDLAVALAAGGCIVIAPGHTGDNQNSSDAIYSAPILRDRPRQLLRALEAVLESPDFSNFVDESRIGLVGVGFGAISVLQLAGALPDFSDIGGYCLQQSPGDAFCEPWSKARLASTALAMLRLEDQEGKETFLPPLTLFAPRLRAVTVPPEVLKSFAELGGPHENAKKKGFWQRLFASKEDKAPPEPEANATLAEHKEQEPEHRPDRDKTVPAEPFQMELDFQGGPLFGGTDSGARFVYIAMTDSPDFRAGANQEPSGQTLAPEPPPIKPDASTVFRRPPDRRRIRGIALIAPAGGMTFSAKALQGVTEPVVIIEAGKDRLYPPEGHTRPYLERLPAPPLAMRLDEADHFSLFARCSRESKANLAGICGRLKGEARKAEARRRDHFLVTFFQSALGMPLPPEKPAGFVAVPREP
jgi:predicted dienelactone hydrolase